MTLDLDSVRMAFPALADGRAYLDGAAGTQTPSSVIEAIADAYRLGLSNTEGYFPSSERADHLVRECRQAVADLTGGDAQGVVMGPNMTTLTYKFSRLLTEGWGPGDEIVVSQLEHDANLRPWLQAAGARGITVRQARVDLDTGELPAEQYQDLIGRRTRMVAVTAASNILGTRPDVPAICAIAHRQGALTFVDGVHLTPHTPVDLGQIGADFYLTSAYKWCGPHLGALVAAPELLASLHPEKLVPASDAVPDRFQTGTPPLADYAGVAAAVDHLAGLAGPGPAGRRERVLLGMAAVEEHETALFRILLGGLEEIPGVRVHGRARQRTPTAYFSVAGRDPDQVARGLAQMGINVWSGDNYAYEVSRLLGLGDRGAVRASLSHYNSAGDVDRFLVALAAL